MMLSDDERKVRCFELGRKGFKNGLKAPAQCAEWVKSLEGIKVGVNSGAADWNRGWFKEQEDYNRKKFPELYK